MESEHYTATSQAAPQVSVCTQGQPGQHLGHLLVLSQEAKSLEQAPEMPLNQKSMQLDTDLYQKPLCEGEYNTEVFPALAGFHYSNLLHELLHQVGSTAIHGATLQLQP